MSAHTFMSASAHFFITAHIKGDKDMMSAHPVHVMSVHEQFFYDKDISFLILWTLPSVQPQIAQPDDHIYVYLVMYFTT